MTTAHASVSPDDRVEARPHSTGILAVLVVPATMLVVVGWVLLLLMTPIWTHFALTTSGGINALATPEMAFQLSDRTVAELLLGPGTFADYGRDEAAHMRDVRLVLYLFLAAAGASVALIVWSLRRHSDPDTWRAIARGGAALVAILVILGVFGALAFGVAFELFHELLFPGGNFAFPPTSRLIQLYPIAFWQLSAAAFGALGIAGGLLAWFVGRRKARQLSAGTGR
jgi:uncharacterized protein DUF1461